MQKARSTTEPTFLDLVDTISRGGTDDWRELYERAIKDEKLQALIAKALPMVDPDLGAARELWAFLLGTIQAPDKAKVKAGKRR